MPPKSHQQYTDEQKQQAIQIALQSDKSVCQVAQDLGINQTTLCRWVRQARVDAQPHCAPGAPLTTDERQELARLRRQVKQLEMERDFLKKAAAFFARDLS